MGSEHPQEGRTSDSDRPAESSGGRGESVDAEGTPTDGEQPQHVPDSGSSVTVSELFELLAQPGNRYTLAYLVRADGAVPYDDLIEYVVDEGGIPDGLSESDFRNQVATRLVHSNLPKLDDAGLVDYDASQRTIRATDATAVAIPYLELAMEQFSVDTDQ